MVKAGEQRAAEVTLPAKATSPSRARRFVAATLAAWGLDGGDDLLLVVSELTTNALLHARTSMHVRLAEEPDGVVLLSVHDGSGQQPRGRDFSVEAGTGRGLLLLESVTREWGVERHDDGKTVWCRIALGGELGGFAEFDVDAVEAL